MRYITKWRKKSGINKSFVYITSISCCLPLSKFGKCTSGDMELEHFFNENLNLKNLTHCAIANIICHESYGTLSPIPVIIWCYCCIYWITESNKCKRSAENGSDSNWNGPISSCVCDVTIIGTSWVNQPGGHWLNFCRIMQLCNCKLVFWTLFQ